MIFNWEKCSIQWMLIGIIISCYAYVYCGTNVSSTRKPATTAYLLLENNPLYVQNFVSKMMSKFPFNASIAGPRDYTGMELDPNLGYEPYWKDFPDLTWAYKCARCPELFKKFKMVCAIDMTGVLAYNMSMCDVARMNCIAGTAKGRSSGIRNDFDNQYFVVQEGWAHVAIRQNCNAIIQLSALPSNTTGDRYTIHIDGWDGAWSGLYRNDRYMAWYKNDIGSKTLRLKEYVDFVMRWDISTGWFLMTVASAANWTQSFHFNVTDPYPFRINYIAVGGTDNVVGDWELKGFLVSTLTPCGPDAAQPLVTSPTEPSVIIKGAKQINKSYFTRIMEANADHNVSFLTQEEY